jgi:hypothetical protein
MSSTEQGTMFEKELVVILNEFLKLTGHKVKERKNGRSIYEERLNPDRIIRLGKKTQALYITLPIKTTTNE